MVGGIARTVDQATLVSAIGMTQLCAAHHPRNIPEVGLDNRGGLPEPKGSLASADGCQGDVGKTLLDYGAIQITICYRTAKVLQDGRLAQPACNSCKGVELLELRCRRQDEQER
jgi:hypothetical protein